MRRQTKHIQKLIQWFKEHDFKVRDCTADEIREERDFYGFKALFAVEADVTGKALVESGKTEEIMKRLEGEDKLFLGYRGERGGGAVLLISEVIE